MRHHILTTGISLLTNFGNSKSPRIPSHEVVRFHKDVKSYLLSDPEKACAEINSLNARTQFLKKRPRDLGVTLIFTETREGKMVASLLKQLLKESGISPIYEIPIKGLDKPAKDATPDWAQQNVTEALTGLRRSVLEHISRLHSKNPDAQIELNCTGGYKAEIAVLYEVGRTLRVPVYYLHETFKKTCVTLP